MLAAGGCYDDNDDAQWSVFLLTLCAAAALAALLLVTARQARNLVSASYGAYGAAKCNVTVDHAELACWSVAGVGAALAWSVTVGGQTGNASALKYALPPPPPRRRRRLVLVRFARRLPGVREHCLAQRGRRRNKRWSSSSSSRGGLPGTAPTSRTCRRPSRCSGVGGGF